ncbi:MAG: response regulator [Candidatus Rifleibacteriota bacterium]
MNSEKSPLILIVDDTSHNLQIAGEVLSREKYRIALAQSGADAIKFLDQQKPDLILLDIMMPDMDGFRVCQYLKDNLETRFIPVIFLTAKAQIEDIIKGFELGGADYLTKPFNDKELLARVKAQLELVKLQEMLRTKNRKLLDEIRLRKQREQDLIDFEKNRFMNVLVDGISHEFNNLLQIILGYGELVARELPEKTELAQHQSTILDAARKASNMVRQLTDFSNCQASKKQEKINLAEFIKDRESLFRSIFPENIKFSFKILDDWLPVNTNKAELTQVLVNLFLNASEAILQNGQITVSLEKVRPENDLVEKHGLQQNSDYALIEVNDNGIGMTKNQLETVFEPFVSFRQKSSLGLGLNLVKSTIKRLDGIIELESTPKEGTSCRIYLPLSDPEEHKEEKMFDETESGKTLYGNDELILLAEDEENVLFLEKKVLENHGYRIIEAKTGTEAVEIFKKHSEKINLVMLDLGLPQMNGIEVGKELKTLGCKVPLVYCTAYTDQMLEKVPIECSILQKPFKPDEMLALIRDNLKKAQKQ